MRFRLLIAGAALAAGSLLAGAVLLPAATNITAAADRPRATPDAAGHAEAAMALLQQARDEATPAYLPQAEAALAKSLRLQPSANAPALVGMAALANARHQFSQSVTWSRRAIKINPSNASAYGLLGDALFELGRVRASEAAYQAMVDRRPDTASYIRASYALQYQGETRAAIRTLKLAAQAAGPTGESAAFVQHQLGDIYAGEQRYGQAERANRAGIAMAPGFVPPTVGVAEAHLARGQLDAALPLLEAAAERLPTIEYLSTLGDVYQASGRAEDAEIAYTRAATTLADYRRNGVEPDADFVLFYADHGVRSAAALREAFAIYDNRPTGKTADALAWMLHTVGRTAQARPYAREAVRAPDASGSTYFHAAQIERSLGNGRAAASLLRQALRQDPAFSVVDAPRAVRQLKALS